MLKHIIVNLLIALLLLPVYVSMAQQQDSAVLEIVDINAEQFPAIELTVNVIGDSGQPIGGLDISNFQLAGAAEDQFSLEDVQTPVAIVLAIDTSDSMFGQPLESVKLAALTLIESLNPGDSVAVVSFSGSPQLVQEFTSDVGLLSDAIQSLTTQTGGTAIHDASTFSIHIAQDALLGRKSVILLSDGAEYGASTATREEALEQAVETEVSVHTIGLGYGTDRSFLEELAHLTNADYIESPGGEQLVDVYSDISARLRTQYHLFLMANVPLDGTVYNLSLRTSSFPIGSIGTPALFSVRAPVPVPLVALATEPFPNDPIDFSEPIIIEPVVVGDEAITEINVLIDGSVAQSDNGVFVIDPIGLEPGTHTLQIQARDVDGDVGVFEHTFDIVETPTPTPTFTITPSVTASATPTETDVPTDTPSPTATPTETDVPTDTPSPTATVTHTDSPTVTSTTTEVAVAANTATSTASATVTHTDSPTVTSTTAEVAVAANTATPSPNSTATNTPSVTASDSPTETNNTSLPTASATVTHTDSPTGTSTTAEVAVAANTATPSPNSTVTNTPSATDTATTSSEIESASQPTLVQFGRIDSPTPVDAERISALSTIEQIGFTVLTPGGDVENPTVAPTSSPTATHTITVAPATLTQIAADGIIDPGADPDLLVRDGLPIESRPADVAGRDALALIAISVGALVFLAVTFSRELKARQDTPTKVSSK